MVAKAKKPISPIFLQFLLFSSSLFVLTCGIALTCSGFYFIYHATGIGVDRSFLFLPGYILVLGICVAAAGIMGIFCVFYRTKCLIGIFIAFMVPVIVCQIMGGSVILALSENLAQIAVNAINVKVLIAKNATSDPFKESDSFRLFQINMGCCGFHGPMDYEYDAKKQCCTKDTCDDAPKKGCKQFAEEAATKYKVIFGLLTILFGVLQISAIVSSIAWAKWKRKPLLV
nr:hypothetical transcript [Hymenolepis microstoma]